MNKIQKLHLEVIKYEETSDITQNGEPIVFVESSSYMDVAVNSAQITEQIAIKFAEWLNSYECADLIHDYKIVGEDYSIKNLYKEFLKNL